MSQRLQRFKNGDCVYAVTDSGPIDGEIVVLLHGFPQTLRIWDAICASLERRGYRTMRFDQRGYTPTARPSGVHRYRMSELVRDVRALVSAASGAPVHLVGHDWGAAIGWAMAASSPSLVRTLTAVSVPHPAAFLRSFLSSDQLLRSYYMVLFQPPGLAELIVRHYAEGARRMLRYTGMSPKQIRQVEVDLIESGALTSAISWYRAMPLIAWPYLKKVPVPTTYVWSTGDMALSRRCVELSAQYVTGSYRLEVLDGSHWIPEEQPDRLAAIIAHRIGGDAP